MSGAARTSGYNHKDARYYEGRRSREACRERRKADDVMPTDMPFHDVAVHAPVDTLDAASGNLPNAHWRGLRMPFSDAAQTRAV